MSNQDLRDERWLAKRRARERWRQRRRTITEWLQVLGVASLVVGFLLL